MLSYRGRGNPLLSHSLSSHSCLKTLGFERKFLEGNIPPLPRFGHSSITEYLLSKYFLECYFVRIIFSFTKCHRLPCLLLCCESSFTVVPYVPATQQNWYHSCRILCKTIKSFIKSQVVAGGLHHVSKISSSCLMYLCPWFL